LVRATEANINQGINKVNTLIADGYTPARAGLTKAVTQYGPALNKLFFLSDGLPNFSGNHSQSVQNTNEQVADGAAATDLLEWFPGAYQPLKDMGCEFVVIHMGASGEALAFMQNLANGVGGTFFQR
jgi:hypothetical protein